MAMDPDNLARSFETENTGGMLSGFLAEEDELDRRALWRLGSWGVASVGAVIIAVYVNQSSISVRRDQVAAADLARQSQQIQSVAKESQSEARRLASAIDTLNGDRDRLYTRVTVLEQGLDSVTGSIARQNAVAASSQAATTAPPATSEPQAAPQNPTPAPAVSPVATTATSTTDKPRTGNAPAAEPAPETVSSVAQVAAVAANSPATATATPLMASKSIMAPPDSAAGKLIEPETPAKTVTRAPIPEVVAPSADDAEPDASAKLVQRTEFAVDVGGANSLGGLRALWRGVLKSNSALAVLQPVIAVKEATGGLGMQLRLLAGPLSDAAAAAKICAALIESDRTCVTAVFDGQRLAMKAEDRPIPAKPVMHRRRVGKRAAVEEPAKKPETSTLSSFFVRR